jgi:hypothetical protein
VSQPRPHPRRQTPSPARQIRSRKPHANSVGETPRSHWINPEEAIEWRKRWSFYKWLRQVDSISSRVNTRRVLGTRETTARGVYAPRCWHGDIPITDLWNDESTLVLLQNILEELRKKGNQLKEFNAKSIRETCVQSVGVKDGLLYPYYFGYQETRLCRWLLDSAVWSRRGSCHLWDICLLKELCRQFLFTLDTFLVGLYVVFMSKSHMQMTRLLKIRQEMHMYRIKYKYRRTKVPGYLSKQVNCGHMKWIPQQWMIVSI